MNRPNRPQGRIKRVGQGVGKISRRGSGQSGRTGGPAGTPSGYANRKSGFSFNTGSRPKANQSAGFPAPYRRTRTKPASLIIIVLIVIAGIFIFSRLAGNNQQTNLTGANPTGGYLPPADNNAVTYVDKGAYAVNTSVSNLARDKRTDLIGNGMDTATIMIYMCGTDLESRAGMATSDLQEIINAEVSDNVNIIIETGGTSKWQNNVISSNSNQRYRVTSQGLELLQDNLGRKSMVDPATLEDFIKYAKNSFPASRYALIMWDHGGGSLAGFGYDQLFPKDAMTLDEISTALRSSGCTFDWIGFDACLMATLETAIVLEPYADYMIASEEVEPGIGWHYTGWVTELSRNPSIATIDLGKKLIDDYVKEVKARTPQSQATLSLIDLAELKGTVPASLTDFSKGTNELIEQDQYKKVSDARASSKEFAASSKINQIDLIHFAENVGTDEAEAFAKVLKDCIKYNRTSTNISNSNGVSIYFPYSNTSQLSSMLSTYDKIGIDEEYSDCLKSFASLTAGGQATAQGSGNMLEVLLAGMGGGTNTPPPPSGQNIVGSLLSAFLNSGDFSGITGEIGNAAAGWLDLDQIKAAGTYYEENLLDASKLVISEKNGQRVLALPEDQWEIIQHMEMNVFIDDGAGFIDLGLDNIYDYNDDGDLVMEYDGTWLAINGRIVSYYMVSDDHNADVYSIKGRVPVLLNDQPADIIIVFDNDNPYGRVMGAQIKYDADTQTTTVAKGLLDINPGDKIDYLCDYYTYEGDYSDTYFLGDTYTATGQWEIENLYLDNQNYQMSYRITDIYGNQFWTPVITDQ